PGLIRSARLGDWGRVTGVPCRRCNEWVFVQSRSQPGNWGERRRGALVGCWSVAKWLRRQSEAARQIPQGGESSAGVEYAGRHLALHGGSFHGKPRRRRLGEGRGGGDRYQARSLASCLKTSERNRRRMRTSRDSTASSVAPDS